MGQAIAVFRDAYGATTSGYASTSVSEAIPVPENADQVTLSSMVKFITGSTSPTLTCTLEYTHDGRVWQEGGTTTTTSHIAVGYKEASRTSVTGAFVRVKAVVSGGTDAEIGYDASVSFSDQA